MIYDHTVIHNGIFYPKGEEVPTTERGRDDASSFFDDTLSTEEKPQTKRGRAKKTE